MSSQELHASIAAAIVDNENLMITSVMFDRLHHRRQKLFQQMTPFPVKNDDAGPTGVGQGKPRLFFGEQKERQARDVCEDKNESNQKIERE